MAIDLRERKAPRHLVILQKTSLNLQRQYPVDQCGQGRRVDSRVATYPEMSSIVRGRND